MGHFEQGGVKIAVAIGLAELADTMPLPVGLGMLAVSGVIGGAGAVQTFIGLGEMMDPEHELRDVDY